MQLYKYLTNSEEFASLSLSMEAGWEITDLLSTEDRILNEWEPLTVEINRGRTTMGQNNPVGLADLHDLSLLFPVLSTNAWDILEPLIGDIAEALPIQIGREYVYTGVGDDDGELILEPFDEIVGDYFLIHPLGGCDCLDTDKSEFKYYSDGGVMRVKKFVFHKELIEGKHLFKIPAGLHIYVSEEFVNTVEQNNLKGAFFNPLKAEFT